MSLTKSTPLLIAPKEMRASAHNVRVSDTVSESAKQKLTLPYGRTDQAHMIDQITLRQACKSVLATPELLENIIIHLPAKNMFGITRISTEFRNCVANSPVIQEMLFFRPSGPPKETWQVIDDLIFWSVNYRASVRRRFIRLEQSKIATKNLASISHH
jgi:hypothetical protein